ncbi:hypothetical protein D5S18_09580 [Nocardia panacis]|uniref:Uncharacterized protein n=1 Tax=Nocardia panacis TaxID=2340916 RepID=A0A3A4KLW1_9NOCA|nr:hypothetical protein D5S18_09580 [Nocardia panacis]
MANIAYTEVWSADTGIDLFSRGAELVRATSEAGYLTQFAGVDKSYPGYNRAVGAPVSWHDEDKSEKLAWSNPVDPVIPKPGTFYNHITDYAASDTQITASVCSYGISAVASTRPASTQVLNDAVQIHLSNYAPTPGVAGIPDIDPTKRDPRGHRVPTWNVFGTWTVARIKFHTRDSIPAGCTDWWQQQFPDFIRSPNYNFLTAPPGYQPPVHPIVEQYPEWIGPSASG